MIPASADIAIYAGAVVSVRFSFESAPAQDYIIRVYDAHSIVSTQTITPTVDGNDLIAEFDADNFDAFKAYRFELRRPDSVPELRGAIRYETAWTAGQFAREQVISVTTSGVPANALLFNGDPLLFNSENIIFTP